MPPGRTWTTVHSQFERNQTQNKWSGSSSRRPRYIGRLGLGPSRTQYVFSPRVREEARHAVHLLSWDQ
jgi:hypothetical protein